VTLAATATLAANGVGSGIAGGQIELATTAGSVQIDPTAQVAANGAAGSGTLLVRAPLTPSGSNVDITSLPADLSQVGLVILEPMIAATLDSAPTAAQFAAIESTLASDMSAARSNILSTLGVATLSNVVVRPYADLTSDGNLTLPSVNFSSWRFDGQPADISIRATGTLTVAGTLSDGFTSSGPLNVMTSPSARISLVAGANLGSASATAVMDGAAADLDLDAGAIVRTGTGALELTAAEDVVFGKGATVYTGGIQGAPSITGDTGVPVSFPTDGGNITVNAGRDVIGAPVTQAVDQWNPRFEPNVAAIWGVDFQEFGWNIGALGGGNVVINAGRNAIDLTAAVADSLTYAADGVTPIAFGGGNLTVTTGGDVGSGLFYVGNGVGRIDAGGALTSTLNDSHGDPLGTLLLAGDASYYVSAQRDIQLQGMLSETALAPGPNSDQVYFFNYGPNSTLALQSRGGSITYSGTSGEDANFIGSIAVSQSDPGVFESAPPNLDFAAFGTDVVFGTVIDTLPSPTGEITVYAARDIISNNVLLGMADVALDAVASAANPSTENDISLVFSATAYSSAALHQNDPVPVVIAAGRDIDDITFNFAKQADISAGRNINGITYAGQNLNPDDATVIRAGLDIEYTSTDTTQSISLYGPGQLDLIAGGNIDLGLSAGVATYGNLGNPNLSSTTGASITVLAGLGAPIGVGGAAGSKDFVGTVIAPSTSYQTMLVDYVEQITGQSNVSLSGAEQTFRNFSIAQQLPLIESVFFDELALSGEEANDVPSQGFGRGYTAIGSLFPGSISASGSGAAASPYAGDLTLGYSRIYTVDGGSISILVPGGNVNVGLAVPPTNFSLYGVTRTPADLGIVAVDSGDVDIYALNDVEVNSSRVFTLGGGNITIWSTLGNIDAGNGAKTSISAPPPTVEVSSDGDVTLDFSAAVAGSGIRTIQSEPDLPAGNVNLIAPVGFVNAGDAGIGSAGNINIAAQRVIGATNINFGGTATGVPPEVSGIGASLAGASSVANSATTASASSVENGGSQSAAAAPIAAAALGWLDVFVEGFGEEVCKANDLECLKRNHKSQ
jgi:hypothetical protein